MERAMIVGRRHRHRMVEITGRATFPSLDCVAARPGLCVPEAHGGKVYTEICRCQAWRAVVVKGGVEERGPWQTR